MAKPRITKKKMPSDARVLTFAVLPQPSGTTLERLIGLIEPYTHIRPVQASYAVGSLVANVDYLGADINDHWGLKDGQAFWSGEVDPIWRVSYLAGYIDLKAK